MGRQDENRKTSLSFTNWVLGGSLLDVTNTEPDKKEKGSIKLIQKKIVVKIDKVSLLSLSKWGTLIRLAALVLEMNG